MKEIVDSTLNIFAQNDTLFGCVIDQEGNVLFKKQLDFHLFEDQPALLKELTVEILKGGVKAKFSKIHLISHVYNKVILPDVITKEYKVTPIEIEINAALIKSFETLENQSNLKTFIFHLDDFMLLGEIKNQSIQEIDCTPMMHFNVDDLGRECFCNKLGCLIQYASPEGLIQTAQEKVEFYSGPTQLTLETPGQLKFKKLVTYTKKGDPLAIEILNQTIKLLVPILVETLRKKDVEKVILSGRLGQFGKLISKPLQGALSECYGKTTPVLTPFSKSYEELFVSHLYD